MVYVLRYRVIMLRTKASEIFEVELRLRDRPVEFQASTRMRRVVGAEASLKEFRKGE
jgi:hypothetical protein